MPDLIEIRKNRKIHIDNYCNTKINSKESKIFLIHGSSGNPNHFRTILPQLKENFNCIVPSLLGHGQSTTPFFNVTKYLNKLEDNPYGFIEIAKDLEAVLDKYGSNDNNNIIIGHSFGGMLGLYLAHKFPDKIKKLILLCPGSFTIDVDSSAFWSNSIKDLEELRPQLVEMYEYMAFHENTDKKLINLLSKDALKIPMHVIQALSLAENHYPKIDFSTLITPTLIMMGESDQVTPATKIKSDYTNIKNIKIKVIPKTGHFIMLEQPEIVMNYIKEELYLPVIN